jgi:hypothetical protein
MFCRFGISCGQKNLATLATASPVSLLKALIRESSVPVVEEQVRKVHVVELAAGGGLLLLHL